MVIVKNEYGTFSDDQYFSIDDKNQLRPRVSGLYLQFIHFRFNFSFFFLFVVIKNYL